ncbi:tetratricopeptide repeat protein 23-like, partial [Leptonychotes weddellii]|uniref:Tetratricopeptide repeat protein 23-like n=1 Tax=Leptonychotes weddellii TaxID=9713 RepID=A0A7F8QS84_LEPWE
MMHFERIAKDYMLYESNYMKFLEEAKTEIEQRSVIASDRMRTDYINIYYVWNKRQVKNAVEIYFIKSINAYQATLGPTDYETLTTIEEFCKWLVQNGEKQEAYRLLKAALRSQVISYGDCSEKVAETFYNMGRICFAKGELRKAIQLLRKCLMIQILLYGSEHSKSRDTRDLLNLLQ